MSETSSVWVSFATGVGVALVGAFTAQGGLWWQARRERRKTIIEREMSVDLAQLERASHEHDQVVEILRARVGELSAECERLRAVMEQERRSREMLEANVGRRILNLQRLRGIDNVRIFNLLAFIAAAGLKAPDAPAIDPFADDNGNGNGGTKIPGNNPGGGG